LTLAYFARIIERMFFREPVEDPAGGAATPSGTLVTDGEGPDGDEPEAEADPDPSRVSTGMQATVLLAAVLAVVLGIVAFEYGQLLEPTIERLLA
jgi:multicomponent Na+:H+ antiporter subunit D